MKKETRAAHTIPEDFVPVPGFPGYSINREGV